MKFYQVNVVMSKAPRQIKKSEPIAKLVFVIVFMNEFTNCTYMIDSHCHIHFQAFKDDYQEVISRCKEKNCAMIAVGTQKHTSQKAIDFANKYENIFATVGLHPIHLFSTHVDEEESSFLSREEDFDYDFYAQLAKQKKVVAIGECGIDLFHLPANKPMAVVLKKQQQVFRKQIDLANDLKLPIVIHVRDGHSQTLSILNSAPQIQGVVHCYSSNWENAKQYLDKGLYIGFTGVITFPAKKINAQPHFDLLEVVKKCPLDRILIETDAPYLAPQAYRGKRCEPWMVEEVAKKIAEIKDKSCEQIISIATKNAQKLFTLKA
ncbi:MAG: TatD family hydrolase [bacterium]